MFPVPVEQLDGRRVLAIAIPLDRSSNAAFVTGTAIWTGSELHVTYDQARPPVALTGSAAALCGFDPAVLPRLIIPPHRSAVLALAADVSACVVAFARDAPVDALHLDGAFFGLVTNANTGEVFLMQGSHPHLQRGGR